MREFFAKRKLNIICSVAAVAFMWIIWIIAYYAADNDYVIPSFTDTFVSLFQCFGESRFWASFGWTVLRTAEAFVISFVLALPCAVGAAFSKPFRHFMSPIIAVLRTLPTLAVVLLLLLWTGVRAAPVIVTVLLLFPVEYAQICAAIDGVDGELLQMAEVYRVPRKDRLFKIYLPLASPGVLSQLGANFSLGLKVTISAEVLANTYTSLGGMMQSARAFLEMPRLAALTLIAVVTGLVVDIALSQLKRVNSKWLRGDGND